MNPIKFSEIIQADNTAIIQSLQQIGDEYAKMVDEIKRETKSLVDAINKSNGAHKSGQEVIEASAADVKELQEQFKLYTGRIKELEKLNKKLEDQNKRLSEQRKQEIDEKKAAEALDRQRTRALEKQLKEQKKQEEQQKKLHQQLREEAELLNREARSIAELQKQTNLLNKERTNLNKTLNPKRFAELTKAIDANNKKLKEFDSEVGRYQRNVGDYLSVWSEMPGAMGAAGQGVSGFGDSLKTIVASPVVLVITTLVAVLGTLANAFSKSERGAALMRKAQAFLSAGMEILIDLSEDAVDFIIKVFEDPMGALEDFGKALQENIINKFKGMLDFFGAAGRAIKALFSRDLEGLKQASKDAGLAVAQIVTGVTVEGMEKMAQATAEAAKEANILAEAFEKLYNQQLANEKLNQRMSLSIEQLRGQEQLLIDQADNARDSFTERKAAAVEYMRISEERAAMETKLARANVAIIEQELKVNQNNFEARREIQKRLTDARLEEIRIQNELVLSRRDAIEKIRALESDDFEQRLDFEESFVDATVEANSVLIANESATAEERARLYGIVQQKAQESWEVQQGLIQQQAKSEVDFTALVQETNAQRARAALDAAGLDEIAQVRVLQALERRRKFLLDSQKLQQDIAKANAEAVKKEYEVQLNAFDQQQELEALQVEGSKKSEREKNAFAIEQQIARYEKQLELAQTFPGIIADTEIAIIKQKLSNARAELSEAAQADEKGGLFSLLGFSEEQQSRVTSILGGILNNVKSFFSERARAAVDAAKKEVDAAQSAVDAAQEAFDQQSELQKQGLANDASLEAQRLANAKAARDKALKEQEAAQKKQAQIETAQQAVSLLTSVANIWKTATGTGPLGYILAGVGTAALFASFAASKIKAKEATTQEFAHGGFEMIGGGTHASGNDTAFAVKDGRVLKAERGESHAIFTGRATSYYGASTLRNVVDGFNALSFDRALAAPESTYSNPDYTQLLRNANGYARQQNAYLERIADRETTSTFVDSMGRTIIERRLPSGGTERKVIRS